MSEIMQNYKEYLDSFSWKAVKKLKLEQDSKCEICGVEATTVHHLSYERLGKEKEEDLASLCEDCHNKCHFVEGYQIKNSESELRKRFEELKENSDFDEVVEEIGNFESSVEKFKKEILNFFSEKKIEIDSELDDMMMKAPIRFRSAERIKKQVINFFQLSVKNNDFLKNDKEFILELYKFNINIFPYIGDELKNDKEIVILFLKNSITNFEYVDKKLKSNKQFILDLYKKYNYDIYKYIDETLKDDKELLEIALKKNTLNFKYASKKLKNNEILILNLLKDTSIDGACFFSEFNKKLRNNKEIILASLKNKLFPLKYINSDLKDDKGFMLKVNDIYERNFSIGGIGNTEYLLEYCSNNLKKDKSFLLKIIKKDSVSFKEYRKKNKNSGFALKKYIEPFNFIDNDLKNDKLFVLKIIKMGRIDLGYNFEKIGEKLRKDKDIILEYIKNNCHGYVFEILEKVLINDVNMLCQALKNQYAYGGSNGYSIERLSKKLRDNKKIGLIAVKNNGYEIKYLSKKLQNDRDIVLEALKSYYGCWVIDYIDEKFKNDKELILEVLKEKKWDDNNIENFLYSIDKKLKNNKDFKLEIEKYLK